MKEEEVNAERNRVVGDVQGVTDAAGCAACDEDDTRSHLLLLSLLKNKGLWACRGNELKF